MKFISRVVDNSKGRIRKIRLHRRSLALITAIIVVVLLGFAISRPYRTRAVAQVLGIDFFNTFSTDNLFPADRTDVSTPSNNSHTGDFGKGIDIALIRPTFTSAAYNYHGFYDFYRRYDNTFPNKNVTTDLNLLRVKVDAVPLTYTSASTYAMLSLLHDIKWVTAASNMTTLSDQDVDKGSIFHKDGTNAYDVIVLGHQEYVTQQEYDNLKQFVNNGGTMIILDGNVFYAQVSYDRATDTVQLVKGHGWAFNGKSAWRSIDERWANTTKNWVGSNYLCSSCSITFGNDPFEYRHHEEQYVSNPNDVILLNYNATISNWKNAPNRAVVATYELNYGRGKVIALGIYSDDIISNGSFDKYLDSVLLKYAIGQKMD